jgi:hypothetical protein
MRPIKTARRKPMSNSEKGHGKNAANFEQLTAYTASLGLAYNPSNPLIRHDALQTLLAKANESLNSVNTAISANSGAVAAREAAFGSLNKLITRVCNSYRSCGADPEDAQNLISVAKKLKGIRVSAKLTEEEKKELAANGIERKQISAAQTSYDSRLYNFDKFVKLLASNSLYVPNEEELKIASLVALHNDLKAKNTAAMESAARLINARAARNNVMYAGKTGMVDVSLEVKYYLKSLDGAAGPKYKAISKLSFIYVK